MFYSHEILTSRQYGVATVWLVATIGNNSSARKVSRKAIQEVDVRRACGKILEPGAPIALRLQGNLLYGISRVHNQQCTYLVTDAKKIQDQMKLFFRAFPGNQLDPEAGRTRPENNLVEDDPAFDPLMPIPQFQFETLIASHEISQKTSSQMSPLGSQFSGSHRSSHGFAVQLDIGHSSSASYHGSPFGLEGLYSVQNPSDKPLGLPDDDVFGMQGDWGFDIDENGNIIESAGPMIIDEEPQLPPLPSITGEGEAPTNIMQLDDQPAFDRQGDVIMQEEPLPEAEPFPEPQHPAPQQENVGSAGQAVARRKRKLRIDDHNEISRKQLRIWQSDYLELCGSHPTRLISAGQAKRNAMLLTFGLGLGNIGQHIGVPGLVHPLAVSFSGDALFTTVTGIEVEKSRGKRRTASEAIEDSAQEEDRHVRPRLTGNEEKEEQARAVEQDAPIIVDDPFAHGPPLEIGREAEHPMSDQHLSSTLLPWNRGSSAVPGSSARPPSRAQQGRDLSSPLGRRGNLQDIVRYSDDAVKAEFGSGGNFDGGLGSADSSYDMNPVPGLEFQGQNTGVEPGVQITQAQNNHPFAELDREGHNFVTFAQDAISRDGERRQDADFEMNRKWLAFDDLFVPQATPRATAAQAFYHTLCLVTKGKMYVEQDDAADEESFGAIWLGTQIIAE
ncbi:Rec8 like protein-domain-containing protein [Nemania sp. FL0916]|nr:Rec8 like protein-domain-containing protein [Nemania sp. FL0916]